jgi:thiol peroxidase
MASIQFKGNPLHTAGDLPKVGSTLGAFKLTKTDLSEISNADFAGKKVIFNIFPSIDTPTCATSVRKFNEKAASLPNTVVLCVSADLPFAQKRFCGAEGINNVVSASVFRHPEFGKTFGLTLVDGPVAGLLARSVIVVDQNGKVTHVELVNELSQEPNYDAALKA